AFFICILIGKLRRVVILPWVLTDDIMPARTTVYDTLALITYEFHRIRRCGIILLPARKVGLRTVFILVYHGKMVIDVTELGINPLLAPSATRYAHGQLIAQGPLHHIQAMDRLLDDMVARKPVII